MATSLVSAISSMVSSIPTSAAGGQLKQGFANIMSARNGNDNDLSGMTSGQVFTFVLVFILSVWLLMFLGAWVFNISIPNIIPAVKKITVLEFFGLYIVCHILFT
jgi:hypothetical protein